MASIIEQTDDDFVLYSGDDSLTLPVLAIGGVGVVSVSAHVVGNEMQNMINTFKAGNYQEAAAMHRQLLSVFKSLFSAPSPTPLKAVLNMNGIQVGEVRLPLVPLSDEQLLQLKKEIQFKVTKAC